MTTSQRNRRVPPRGNPDEGQQQQHFTGSQVQSGTIPWKLLIITTGVTTVTGYVILEGIRGLHRHFTRRREEKLSEANPEIEAEPPGRLDNGNFQLPVPEGAMPAPMSGPAHGGFASPQAPPHPGHAQGRAPAHQPAPFVDVNNPMGALQHQFQQHQAVTDQRFHRLEQLLIQSQQQPPHGRTG